MSLQLVQVDLAHPQDRQDLLTIYEHGWDTPPGLPQLAAIGNDASRLLHAVAEHNALHFYAVRFNDRLIAACIVDRSQPSQASVDALHVRRSSAGRDVERRLLDRVLRELSNEADEILVYLPPQLRDTVGDLHLAGFDREPDWHEKLLFRRQHARS